MSRKVLFCLFLLSWTRSLPAAERGLPAETTTSERVNFPPGGVIHILHSYGTLKVEGWDRPEVEVIVTRQVEHHPAARISINRRSDTDLAIATTLPTRRFQRMLGKKGALLDKVTSTARHPLGGQGGGTLEYLIHVPSDSRMTIHHGDGMVLVSEVTGDVEANSAGGDILLMLPASGTYSIDARSRLGTVASDFEGSAHRRHLVGSGFTRVTEPSARRIRLRTRLGGITIKAVPESRGR